MTGHLPPSRGVFPRPVAPENERAVQQQREEHGGGHAAHVVAQAGAAAAVYQYTTLSEPAPMQRRILLEHVGHRRATGCGQAPVLDA